MNRTAIERSTDATPATAEPRPPPSPPDQSGSNGIGIPDLIIAHNAKENGCEVFSLDKHFLMLGQILGVKLYQMQNL